MLIFTCKEHDLPQAAVEHIADLNTLDRAMTAHSAGEDEVIPANCANLLQNEEIPPRMEPCCPVTSRSAGYCRAEVTGDGTACRDP